MARLLKKDPATVSPFCSSQVYDHMYVALQTHGELVGLCTYIRVYFKMHKIPYFVDYKSPLYELNLPEHNYFLVTLSIVYINNSPTVHIVVDIPEVTPLNIFTMQDVDLALNLLRKTIRYSC